MKPVLKKTWKWIKRIFIFIFIFHLAYLLYCKWFFPPVTFTQLGSLFSGEGLKRDYVSYKNISPNARLAVIAAEDQLFGEHNGFDWKSIDKAIKWNEKHPNRIRGASTISQQTAKNVFLWQGGGWFRKGLEVYYTFMIERLYGKQRILVLYLNVIEMGKGIYGIECAAQWYFKKPAKKLSVNESAMIAACLPNPVRYTVKPQSRWVARRYPWIVRQMSHLRGEEDIAPLLR
jgi:monofunctional biosynthetic peptidoglycan transglycosylase